MNQAALQQLMREAVGFHQQGNLAEAARLYEQILAAAPGHFDANHMLGIARAQQGRNEEGLRFIDAALKIRPDAAKALANRANIFKSMGRFSDALASYDRALGVEPEFAEGWNNRGNVLMSLRRFEEALGCYDKALAIRPGDVLAHCNRARALWNLRRFDEALASHDKALAFEPDFVEGWNGRGDALRSLARPAEALASYDRAIALDPRRAEAHHNRGNVLHDLGRTEEAVEGYNRAVALNPGFAGALNNLGNALSDLGRPGEALASYDRAIAANPKFAEAHGNRGNELRARKRFGEALESYDRAIALNPDSAEFRSNRGNVLADLGRLEEALGCFDRALALDPRYAKAWSNRGNVLKDFGRLDDAVASYDRAIALDPALADAHVNKSFCLLLTQRFEEGWRLYEWRHRSSEPTVQHAFTQPAWLGEEDIGGKTLLMHAEQGLGDTIQFCRYAKLVRERGAKPILAVPAALTRLIASAGFDVVDWDRAPGDFDYQIPMLSLPFAFGTNLGNIPAAIPYLKPELARVQQWRERIGGHGLKVGICWHGSAKGADVGKSFPVRHFEGISKIPGVRLISLQKHAGCEQLLDLPPGMKVETLGDDFDAGPDAFLDSAGVMENLDLVITADTSLAHLAGALGRPAWVALIYVADWRWLLDRADSPWYPSLRLFRQSSRGDWTGVFAEMQPQLLKLAGPR